MKSAKPAKRFELLLSIALLSLVSAALYLPFINRFGYFNDDWYLMYAAGTKGAVVFKDIFSVDRPLRALVMLPAYSLFGANPLYYNLSAFLVRLIGSLSFMWILRMLWAGHNRVTLWMALLFLVYPGFLSQPNAIDYLCHLSGLAAGMLSIALTIKAVQATSWQGKLLIYIFSILLGWFYLGQIEWFIGLEFLRFACMFILAARVKGSTKQVTVRRRVMPVEVFFRWAAPVFLVPVVFLVWRLFFFESERGATDVDLQFSFSDVVASPMAFLFNWSSTFLNDFVDVLFRAWVTPLRRLSNAINSQEWFLGYGIAVLLLAAIWVVYRLAQRFEKGEPGDGSGWKREAIWLGLGTIVFGLLPFILVGRSVDFRSYSRYTLIASAGVALLWPVGLSYISNIKLWNIFLGLLVASASLTHYANGLAHVRETEAVRDFWWQVSWRIPQMDVGTTLVAHYFVVAEEDYFIWGPANLIYYPESTHERYVQPGIYAALLNQETVSKVLARQPQEFSNRRSIRTYPNYRNILILTRPTPDSCVQVIDGNQVELSSAEDPRLPPIASFSEAHHIWLEGPFQIPPEIPFGPELPHGWCYYYEKASFFRQLGDWEQVARLAEEALALGFSAKDPIEWLPLLQAYARFDDVTRLEEIAPFVTSDLFATGQACQTLTAMPLSPLTLEQVEQLFCLENQ